MSQDLSQLRTDYDSGELRRADLTAEPLAMVRAWLDAAIEAGEKEPTAMTLATVDTDGLPDARIVLLKGLDEASGDGFHFFTNYESAKGRQLDQAGHAAVCLVWLGMHRQVRARGIVSRLDRATSEAYFASRPRGSQLGAWASPQSQTLVNREELETLWRQAEERFEGGPVTLPDHWGGYCLEPDIVEFWQGQRSRLHDRFRYSRKYAGHGWLVERLAP